MKFIRLIFLFITVPLIAQNYTEKTFDRKTKAKLQSDLQSYLDATYNKDWDRVADMIYPGLYQLAGKEEILRALNNGTESLEYKIDFHPSTGLYIYPAYLEKDQKKYALISYTNNFTMTFHKKPDENELSFKGRMDYTYHKLKQRYADNQVIRGAQPGIFHFKIPKYMLAVYLPEKGSYTFIDFPRDPAKASLLQRIIDQDIIDYFNRKINK